jgi:hypothetical protein
VEVPNGVDEVLFVEPEPVRLQEGHDGRGLKEKLGRPRRRDAARGDSPSGRKEPADEELLAISCEVDGKWEDLVLQRRKSVPTILDRGQGEALDPLGRRDHVPLFHFSGPEPVLQLSCCATDYSDRLQKVRRIIYPRESGV